MTNKTNVRFLLFGLIGFIGFYFGEGLIINIIYDQSGFFDFLRSLYPSLAGKLQLEGPQTLIAFSEQLKFRWLIVLIFGYYLFYYAQKEGPSSNESSLVGWKIKLFYVIQLIYLPDLLQELRVRGQWKALFQPLSQFSFFESAFPLQYYIQVSGILIFGCTAILLLAKWKEKDFIPLIISVFILLVWTYLLSLFFGFGKIDHTYASLYSGMLGIVVCQFIIYFNPDKSEFGFKIFQAFIWSCYFFSGLEKVMLSGIDWVQANHFEVLCALHPNQNCEAILPFPVLGSIILVAGLGFQLLSCLQWKWPFWGFVNIAGGIIFHLGTWLIFDIGGWQSPWIIVLIFLWPGFRKNNKSSNLEIVKNQ